MSRLQLFPLTTKIENNILTIGGHSLSELAEQYGTPFYLYDRATMDSSIRDYKSALASYYPGTASVTYAGKAYLGKSIAQWTRSHDLLVDCTGEGELAMAMAGGVPRSHLLVHGVNKSMADLHAAVQHAGTIVVDNLAELVRIREIFLSHPAVFPDLWLRLLPGVAVDTHHAHTQTGQHDSKFGMTPEEFLEAAEFCKQNQLPLNGIHFHQGSNFRDAAPLRAAIEIGLDLAKELRFSNEWHFCPGGDGGGLS